MSRSHRSFMAPKTGRNTWPLIACSASGAMRSRHHSTYGVERGS
jgi:hypothetical protein